MKKTGVFFIAITLMLFGFRQANEERFAVDSNKSSIEWKARKVTGQHNGTIKLSSGYLLMNSNTLTGGAFTADMGSISISDLKGKSKENLLNHLKSTTFFAVADYPNATFQITKVASGNSNQITITGNLTIKGITNTLSFPATVKREKNSVTATTKNVRIDRTKYAIKYRSKNFFGDVGDLAIDDEFEISVNLVAKK